jgi:hypothetical protein
MEKERTDQSPVVEVWWKPAILIFSKVSWWILWPIILSLIVGKYLDHRFATAPRYLLICVGASFLISMFQIFSIMKKYLKEMEKIASANKEIKDK